MIDYKLLGKRLKRARVDAGLTQQKVAELIDVTTPNYVSQVETGRSSVTLDSLSRFANLYGHSPSYFIDGVIPEIPDYMLLELSTEIHKLTTEQRAMVLEYVLLIQNYSVKRKDT